MPIGIPGCPLLAACTASMDNALMAFAMLFSETVIALQIPRLTDFVRKPASIRTFADSFDGLSGTRQGRDLLGFGIGCG